MSATIPTKDFSFPETMELQPVPGADGELKYFNPNPAGTFDYGPGKPLSKMRAYGGHVYAQAIWAASYDLQGSGFHVHEANGYWLRAGFGDRPYIYNVSVVSQSSKLIVRQVTAQQPKVHSDVCPFPSSDTTKELSDVVFLITCSFKQPEPKNEQYWLEFDRKKYGDILKGDPATYPVFVKIPGLKQKPHEQFINGAGIDIRTPDLQDFNSVRLGPECKRLHVYQSSFPMADKDPNMHAAAHAYVSDRAGTILIMAAMGGKMSLVNGSLNQKTIFHATPEEMLLSDKDWVIQEQWSSRAGSSRVMLESRIWSPTGILIASTVQDLLYRPLSKAKLS